MRVYFSVEGTIIVFDIYQRKRNNNKTRMIKGTNKLKLAITQFNKELHVM